MSFTIQFRPQPNFLESKYLSGDFFHFGNCLLSFTALRCLIKVSMYPHLISEILTPSLCFHVVNVKISPLPIVFHVINEKKSTNPPRLLGTSLLLSTYEYTISASAEFSVKKSVCLAIFFSLQRFFMQKCFSLQAMTSLGLYNFFEGGSFKARFLAKNQQLKVYY